MPLHVLDAPIFAFETVVGETLKAEAAGTKRKHAAEEGQAEPPRKRGRPKGSNAKRTKAYKFTIVDAVQSQATAANMKNHPEWQWDGNMTCSGHGTV